MIRNAIAAAAILGGALAASAAEITGSQFSSGNWEGAAYSFDDTGYFSHCAISVEYVGGDTLYFGVNSDATVTIAVASQAMNVPPGQDFPASLHIDRRNPFYATATALDTNFAALTITDFQAAMRALQQGRSMRVESAYFTGNYDLSGSFRALEAARQCAIRQLDDQARYGPPKTIGGSTSAAAAPEPKAAPATSPSTGGGTADRTVLFQIATEMIAEIGVRQFRYLDAAESRDIAGHDSVFWVSDQSGILGGVVITPMEGASLRDSDSGDLSFVSADCAGDVATSTRSMTLENLEAREIRALCVEPDGQMETLLTKIRIGDAVLYTILGFGDGSEAATSQARREVSQGVALRAASFVTNN